MKLQLIAIKENQDRAQCRANEARWMAPIVRRIPEFVRMEKAARQGKPSGRPRGVPKGRNFDATCYESEWFYSAIAYPPFRTLCHSRWCGPSLAKTNWRCNLKGRSEFSMPLAKQWLSVYCPKCNANPGESCMLVGKKHPYRGSSSQICHGERVALFKLAKIRSASSYRTLNLQTG